MTRMYRKSDLYERHKANMNNEPLEMEYTINKDMIFVTSPNACTTFSTKVRKNYIDQMEFINLIKELKREARKNGTKLKGINKLLEYINENYSHYNTEFTKYDEMFDVLAILWEQNVNNIKTGYRDNVIHHEIISKYEGDIERMLYGNCVITIFEERYNRLRKILNEIKEEKALISVEVA